MSSRGERGAFRAKYGIFRLFFAGAFRLILLFFAILFVYLESPYTTIFLILLYLIARKIW